MSTAIGYVDPVIRITKYLGGGTSSYVFMGKTDSLNNLAIKLSKGPGFNSLFIEEVDVLLQLHEKLSNELKVCIPAIVNVKYASQRCIITSPGIEQSPLVQLLPQQIEKMIDFLQQLHSATCCNIVH